ncbi:hypothetical protein GJ496_003738 [Pomphorhynchus laevis]|nr:hypothetical protein GJ496_003738 [Pomphorhynchus laevis]
MALEYLHTMDVLYRDLKPENVMMTETCYLKLGDLGFAKQVNRTTRTFCGTPEYLAPEIIMHRSYGRSVDWWSFGILLFELNAGMAPFLSKDQSELFQKICKDRIRFPQSFTNSLKGLITGLLTREVGNRYGCIGDGSRGIKNHRWFSDINFAEIFHQRLESPYKMVPPKNYRTKGEQPIKISVNVVGEKEFENF